MAYFSSVVDKGVSFLFDEGVQEHISGRRAEPLTKPRQTPLPGLQGEVGEACEYPRSGQNPMDDAISGPGF